MSEGAEGGKMMEKSRERSERACERNEANVTSCLV